MSDWDWGEIFKALTPANLLKWGLVVFAYALMVLVVVSIILAMVGYY